MTLSIVNPLLLTRLQPAFFTARCTIQTTTQSQSSSGEPTDTWGNVSGLVDIPCAVGRAGGSERKGPEFVTVEGTHTIALAGYYPTITPAMRATVGSNVYDILNTTSDPTSSMTSLGVRQVTAP